VSVLVLVDHDRGTVTVETYEALNLARSVIAEGEPLEAALIGTGLRGLAADLGGRGVSKVHLVDDPILDDYGPEAWGEALAQLVVSSGPAVVIAPGTDRGNEVMAQMAARAELPLAVNVVAYDRAAGNLTRLRWGGSLLENAVLNSPLPFLTVAPHALDPVEPGSGESEAIEFSPLLDAGLARTKVVDRVTLSAGATLATAPVVVSGGRGVGGSEGFAVLEELASLLGGVVGCSRVVTNNGWRPHADQVGQTGTRVAPTLYMACGISGAIQHWVGCMAAKNIMAINIDPEAPMVSKADYAVIGDLHEVLPAVVAEIKRRQG
jgi:electron transfer flavoprotein alpha subunit